MRKVCRAWVKESGGELYTPPDLVLPSSVKVDEDKIELKLAGHPLVAALCRKKRWAVTPEFLDFTLLEARLSGNGGQLSLSGNASKYDIKIPKPDSEAIAYYFPNADNKSPLTVELVDRITGQSQIVVKEGGKIYASPNLSGQTVKIRTQVIYREATQELQEPIEKLDAHLVFKEGESLNRRWQYLELKQCEFEPLFGNRIKLVNWQDSQEEWL